MLDRKQSPLFDELFGGQVEHWRNVEIPMVENKRCDLVAETASGIGYLEIDSRNRIELLPRAARNLLAMKDSFLPKEVTPVVFYIGRGPLTLPCPYEQKHVTFRYKLVEARSLPGRRMIDSANIQDNILAILMDADQEEVVTTVARRLGEVEPMRRGDFALQFALLGGLRGMSGYIIERVRKMVTIEDLMENDFFGPALQRKFEEVEERGLREGHREGHRQGRETGERHLLRLQLERRFGPLSREVEDRLAHATEPAITRWALRFVTALTLDEVFE